MLINGDSLNELKKLDDNSVDLIVTDPPYGYSFMGKEWDKALPDKRIWKECLRVLKAGGFAYVMSAPRQDVLSRMMIDLEDVGFKTDFTSMYWAYATGFPKALNISKAVDKKLDVKPDSAGIVKGMGKQNPEFNGTANGRKENYLKPEYEKTLATSPEAKKLDGSYAGFQPKPAVEVIIVCMKPLDEKTYIEQAMKNGKGVSWFDNCRIPTSDSDKYDLDKWYESQFIITPKASKSEKNKGCEDFPDKKGKGQWNIEDNGNSTAGMGNFNPLCLKCNCYRTAKLKNHKSCICDNPEWRKPKNLPTKNNHPTVKPLKLMSYLITLGSREGDVILDPFMGSGTTPLASKNLNRKYIGIEREEEYFKICCARVGDQETVL